MVRECTVEVVAYAALAASLHLAILDMSICEYDPDVIVATAAECLHGFDRICRPLAYHGSRFDEEAPGICVTNYLNWNDSKYVARRDQAKKTKSCLLDQVVPTSLVKM